MSWIRVGGGRQRDRSYGAGEVLTGTTAAQAEPMHGKQLLVQLVDLLYGRFCAIAPEYLAVRLA